MHDKPVTFAVYVALGLLLAFSPILLQVFRPVAPPVQTPSRDSALGTRRSWILWGMGCVTGLVVAFPLVWWRKAGDYPSLFQICDYLLIVGLCLFAFALEWRAGGGIRAPRWVAWGLGFLAVALTAPVVLSTGIQATSLEQRITAWHHWGAYIAPAELMRAGERIFHDFPAQYGFGPTAILAVACRADCWTGMYVVAAAATLMLVVCAVALSGGFGLRTAAGLAAVLGSVLATLLLWQAYAQDLSTPLVRPSVGGLRFLPSLALVVVLWWTEASPRLAPYWRWIGLALFAIGALWAPEALFMSLMVWGPYYCVRRLNNAPVGTRLRMLALCLVEVSLMLLAAAVVFSAPYRLAYGVLPDPRIYLIYMLYPPGPLPIDPMGPIWFLAAAIALGVFATWVAWRRRGNDGKFRSLLALVLLSYASLSYALGRSHSNNFVNVLPFSALILGSLTPLRVGSLPSGMAAGMLASLLGLLPMFGWSSWVNAIARGRLLEVEPRALISAFSPMPPSDPRQAEFEAGQYLNDKDLTAAMAYVRGVSKDPVSLVPPSYVNIPREPVWNPLHGPANYVFMPDQERITFVKRGAERLRRSGWIVAHKTVAEPWLGDLSAAYVVTEQKTFGDYRAVHFAPKT